MTALPPLPALIGLSGYAGAGKNTLAALLAERHGYQVRAFADPLRELCRKVNPIIGWPGGGRGSWPRLVRWAELETEVGYEAAKAHDRFGAEFRGVMQRLGTEARSVLGDSVWAGAAFGVARDLMADGGRVVLADARFENEAAGIRWHGGLVIRIERPGVGPVNGHVSETALDGWPFDAVLVNDGPPEQMLEQLAAVYALPEVAR